MMADDVPAEPISAMKKIVTPKLKTYVDSPNHTHTFFSHFRPDYLLTELTTRMTEKGQAFTISDTNWKLTFDAKQPLNDEEEADSSVQAMYEYAKI